MNDLDPKGLEAVRENLTSRITRPIIGIENRTAQEVFDIMCDRFRHLSAVPDGEGEVLAWLHRPTGNVFKDGECQKLIEVWQRQFADIPADEIAADFIPLFPASRLSQAGVRVKPSTIFQALRPYFRASVSHVEIIETLEAALSGDTL